MTRRNIVGRTLRAGRDASSQTQNRVEALAAQMQRMSEEQIDQVVAFVSELKDRSVTSGEQMASVIDRRVQEQLRNFGLATKSDVERLEAKIEQLSSPPAGSKKAPKKAAKKAATKAAKAVKKAPSTAAKKAAKKAAGKPSAA